MFEEHVDIFKHLKCFAVMCVCFYFLFLVHTAVIHQPVYATEFIKYILWYCRIFFAEYFNTYLFELIEIVKHFI